MIPLIVKICVVFGVMQLIDNFLLQQSVIFSNSVKAHPLEVFLVVISAGTIWGITGMVIAIPFFTPFFESHSQGISVRIQNHSRID